MDCCSGDELLRDLLDEKLEASAHAAISLHVETCSACQERLKRLTSRSTDYMKWGYFGADLTARRLTRGHIDRDDPRPRDLFTLTSTDGRAIDFPITGPDVPFPEIDGYEFLATLGHGGMGVVYKARQQRLNRLVAVKMIRSGSLARPEDLARFRIEAETVAKLSHANIIQIFDVGEIAGLPYVALELLEGGSLDAILADKPRPETDSARLIATLARAIHVAHQAGIVHRDLKPSNVLFTADGTPKITDFGLAKRLQEDGHTETGQVMGSPSYIPPEQAEGRAREAAPATDVYALGAILYEMLTGQVPFKGATPMETLIKVMKDDPIAPSRLQSQLSRDLETICLKCLAKEPQKRYATAQALALDLDRYLSGQRVQAERTPVWLRLFKFARRRQLVSTLVGVLLIAASVMAIAAVRDRARIRELRDESSRTFRQIRAGEIDSGSAREKLSQLETKLGSYKGLARLRRQARELLDQMRQAHAFQQRRAMARERYEAFFRLREDAFFRDTELAAANPSDDLAAIRDSALAALKLYEAVPARADRWSIAPLSDLNPHQQKDVRVGCYEMLVVLAEATARPLPGESAVQQAQSALKILERAAALLEQPTHAFQMRRAACLDKAGDSGAARREYAIAASIPPSGAFDHFLSGLERYKEGLLNPALVHFEAALGIEPDHFWAKCLLAICRLNARPSQPAQAQTLLTACIKRHPDLPWLYLLRGFASAQLGEAATDPIDKKTNFEAADADYREVLDRDDAQRFRYALLVNRGLLRFQSGKPTEAIADLKEAIAFNPRQINAQVSLAQIDHSEHRLDLALDRLGQAIALNPDQPALYRMRARWILEKPQKSIGLHAAALVDLREAIKRDRPDNPLLADDHAEIGRILLLDKNFQEALAACNEALRINPDKAEVHRLRVVALLELKRYDEAVDACDRSLRAGLKSPDLLGLRGLAKSKRNDFSGAIEDYTLALVSQPRNSVLHCRRGWAYLMSGGYELARSDFDEAIRLDSAGADAYSGRGSTLVALGHYRAAVLDAEESLRHGDIEAHLVYTAARTLAQAAQSAAREPRPRGKPDLNLIRDYQDRAMKFLRQAFELTPREARAAFWREVVEPDPALNGIRRLAEYARLAQSYGPPPR
jgi:serine/threonine protein kinase/Flp pilus assembly protein TadD